jgi:hypothetical protein
MCFFRSILLSKWNSLWWITPVRVRWNKDIRWWRIFIWWCIISITSNITIIISNILQGPIYNIPGICQKLFLLFKAYCSWLLCSFIMVIADIGHGNGVNNGGVLHNPSGGDWAPRWRCEGWWGPPLLRVLVGEIHGDISHWFLFGENAWLWW